MVARPARRSPPLSRVVAYVPRERARTAIRRALARRSRIVVARTRREFAAAFHSALTDAAIVDLGAPGEDAPTCAAMARDFPSVAFLAVSPFRPVDTPLIARCAELDFADVLADGVDDGALRYAVAAHGFSARFTGALREPPLALGLTKPLQVAAWREIVARAGRNVRTEALASALAVTREHLSRAFSADDAPNLKRVIDIVRLMAAAELAKNPGYDLRSVARLLNFTSASHLSTAAQRLVGTRAGSLSALRGIDLIERFVRGRTRSRG